MSVLKESLSIIRMTNLKVMEIVKCVIIIMCYNCVLRVTVKASKLNGCDCANLEPLADDAKYRYVGTVTKLRVIESNGMGF